MRVAKLIPVTLVLSACFGPRLPPVAPTRPPVPVNASFDKTWDAVVAIFAERNLPVTQDTTGRTVYTATIQLPQEDTGGEDCPTRAEFEIVRPQYVTYRVGVTGDATKSAVSAFALYARMPGSGSECGTRGTWESAFESEVKRRAEQP